jgi:SAM-dependent methyltransferase
VLLREKARAKYANADRMYFTREALEQSSGEAVSAYRAGRFAGIQLVLDLCCGVGMDAIQLALAGRGVYGIEVDPVRAGMANANAGACGVRPRVIVQVGDVLTMPMPNAQAVFADPSRRAGGRRVLDPERYEPPLGAVLGRLRPGVPLAVKIAPGVARSHLERYDAEAEFLSVDGELKECALWFGPLRSAKLRATVLPGPHTLAAQRPVPEPPPEEPGEFVFDPDPAVIRADLVGLLAGQLEAVPVDGGVAFLTGRRAVRSPFADCYRVEHAAPFHVGKVRDYLREHGVGRVTILKRAVELDVNEVTRKLKPDGPEHRHLILVRSLGRTVAIVAEKVSKNENAHP